MRQLRRAAAHFIDPTPIRFADLPSPLGGG
jgi:hypothetical protein